MGHLDATAPARGEVRVLNGLVVLAVPSRETKVAPNGQAHSGLCSNCACIRPDPTQTARIAMGWGATDAAHLMAVASARGPRRSASGSLSAPDGLQCLPLDVPEQNGSRVRLHADEARLRTRGRQTTFGGLRITCEVEPIDDVPIQRNRQV